MPKGFEDYGKITDDLRIEGKRAFFRDVEIPPVVKPKKTKDVNKL
jgi:hypothetical protein